MIDNEFLGVIKTFLAINLKKLLVMQFIRVGPFFNLQMIPPYRQGLQAGCSTVRIRQSYYGQGISEALDRSSKIR